MTPRSLKLKESNQFCNSLSDSNSSIKDNLFCVLKSEFIILTFSNNISKTFLLFNET